MNLSALLLNQPFSRQTAARGLVTINQRFSPAALPQEFEAARDALLGNETSALKREFAAAGLALLIKRTPRLRGIKDSLPHGTSLGWDTPATTRNLHVVLTEVEVLGGVLFSPAAKTTPDMIFLHSLFSREIRPDFRLACYAMAIVIQTIEGGATWT
jgi:hypothetical protein